ncbi:hypothetical protein [Clostridium sp. DJ247]|uniref:hypothetical protein n=1 Tax=Clostridium sp. DJ247 TaxID=2726188 RepID=UPI0016283F3D|nr:hypothetical protein [Clostridium sp. DJ247]MBC2582478.1 hypothetical protein [Clostridium sp. DJ247]
MKTIAIIGGSKNFNNRLSKMLKSANIECKAYTKYMVKKESHYDYVVLNSNSSIKDVLINGGYCFVNMDLIDIKSNNANVYGNIITYGFGSKNTVTVSSMEDHNSFVYCLQRDVNYNALGIIEPEEVPVEMEFGSEEDIYVAMVGITIILIEGKDIDSFSKRKNYLVSK